IGKATKMVQRYPHPLNSCTNHEVRIRTAMIFARPVTQRTVINRRDGSSTRRQRRTAGASPPPDNCLKRNRLSDSKHASVPEKTNETARQTMNRSQVMPPAQPPFSPDAAVSLRRLAGEYFGELPGPMAAPAPSPRNAAHTRGD